MSEKQYRSLPHEEELAEIELSAEQVLSLTERRGSVAPAMPAAASRSQGVAEDIAATPRGLDRWRSVAAITGIGTVLALAATIGYEQLRFRSFAPPPPPPPVEEIEESPPQVTTSVSDQPPVRVRNPFDKNEVFEFPPGTSPEEAHAAVADTLLERARERQAQYAARHPRKRRSG